MSMFLNQDYPDKEFVILNDDPDVEYVCRHPEVRIYNWKYRFRNIREKMNRCVSFCTGDVFIPIADDDIWEPHATSRFVKEIGDDPFVACKGFWKHTPKGKMFQGMGIAGLYVCRLDFFKKMGGYAKWLYKLRNDKTGWDWVVHPENFLQRVQEAGCYKEFVCKEKEGFFTWYRFADHSNWDMKDESKFELFPRTPKVIEIG